MRDDTGSRFVVREGKLKTTKLWPRDNNKYCRSRDLQPITYVPVKWSCNQTLNSVMHTYVASFSVKYTLPLAS